MSKLSIPLVSGNIQQDASQVKQDAVHGSYRAHKAAVMASMRHFLPNFTRAGVDKTWYRCLSPNGLNVILSYIRQTTSDRRTAAEVRDAIHELGAPRLRGLPKAQRAATAIRVSRSTSGEGSEDVIVVCVGILPYARCVWQNLQPVAINVKTLTTEVLSRELGVRHGNLYVTGNPPVVESDNAQDTVERLVETKGAMVSARHINMATRNVIPNMEIIGLDTEYICIDEVSFREALEADTTDQLQYIPNVRDCDNFAEFVRVNFAKIGMSSVGVVWDYSSVDSEGKISPHAYNVVALLPNNDDPINDNNLPYIVAIEPQTDQFVQLGVGMFMANEGKVLW